MPERVNRKADHVYGELKEAILAGTLEPGKRADFALYRVERPAELCYNLGANPCVEVVWGGETRSRN